MQSLNMSPTNPLPKPAGQTENLNTGLTPNPDPSQSVYIRVRRDILQPLGLSTATNSTSTDSASPGLPFTDPRSTSLPSKYLYLIHGTLEDISRYAGTTVDWIIKVAHLICSPGPTGRGRVYTHTTGTSQDCYLKDRSPEWREVRLGDTLLPGIYEFEPEANSSILLSRLNKRSARSKTSPEDKSLSTTFHSTILERDVECVVTGQPMQENLVATHLIPKRMGAEGVRSVLATFEGEQAALDAYQFHPKTGILLFVTLNNFVNRYQLGFYHNSGNTYTLHSFRRESPDLTYEGLTPRHWVAKDPRLHSFQVTLSAHSGTEPLPPKGVFDWHYLQCVAQQFTTEEYKNFPGIWYPVNLFKTDEDDDLKDEEDLSDFDARDDGKITPPWPTYRFDRFMEKQWRKHMEQERNEEILQWCTVVANTNSEILRKIE